jgi:hypothetical protein
MDNLDAKIKQYAKKGHLFLDGDVINKAKKFKKTIESLQNVKNYI